jgi:diacylglycerol kinase (ATP)
MWLVVINPSSGQGKGAAVGSKVTSYLSSRAIEYQVLSANSAQSLRIELEVTVDATEYQGIISVGGDGLAHLVLQVAIPRKIPFAVIPAGTGNDIVRTLGWSLTDIDGYLDRIISTEPSAIDLGNVDSEWFAAILSTGFDSVVNERANSLSWPHGPQRYNLAIAFELPKFKPIEYEITMDSVKITTEAMLIAVGNGRSYGGGMLVCPHAQINDGLFDVMILEPVSKVEFLKVFPKVFSGSHLSHPAVKTYRTQKISISADAVAYADGERIGRAPVSAECIAAAGLTWAL